MVDGFSSTSTDDVIEEKNSEAGPYRWVVFSAFVACNTAGFLIANTIGILLPSIADDILLTPTEQGILSSAPFWANLTLMVVVSWWTSRYRPKILVSITMLLGAIFLFVQGWAPTFLALFLGRLAFGVTMIAREPARSLLIRQWLPQRETNMAGGISNLFFGIIVSGGLLLTPIILNYFDGNWRPTMNSFGAFFLILGVIWQVLGRERNPVTTRTVEETSGSSGEFSLVKKAFSFREVWIAGIGFTGALMAFSSFNSFFPTMALSFYDIFVEWIWFDSCNVRFTRRVFWCTSGLLLKRCSRPRTNSGICRCCYGRNVLCYDFDSIFFTSSCDLYHQRYWMGVFPFVIYGSFSPQRYSASRNCYCSCSCDVYGRFGFINWSSLNGVYAGINGKFTAVIKNNFLIAFDFSYCRDPSREKISCS